MFYENKHSYLVVTVAALIHSMETDIRVWKNAVRCFINSISKKQAEKNGLRQIVLFKIIILYLFLLLFILFLTFSGTHERPCVQVATPLDCIYFIKDPLKTTLVKKYP